MLWIIVFVLWMFEQLRKSKEQLRKKK